MFRNSTNGRLVGIASVGALAVIGFGAGVVVWVLGAFWTVVLLLLAAAALLALMRRDLPFAFFSPVWIASAAFLAIGVVGYIAAPLLETTGGVAAQISLNSDESKGTLLVFLVSAVALLAGAFSIVTVGRYSTGGRIEWPRRAQGFAATSKVLILTQTGPLFLVMATGRSGILSREDRLLPAKPIKSVS